jgi:translation initiation factor IF-3
MNCSAIRSDESRGTDRSLHAFPLRVKVNPPPALLQNILYLLRRRVDEFEPVHHPCRVPDDCGHFPSPDRLRLHQFPHTQMVPDQSRHATLAHFETYRWDCRPIAPADCERNAVPISVVPPFFSVIRMPFVGFLSSLHRSPRHPAYRQLDVTPPDQQPPKIRDLPKAASRVRYGVDPCYTSLPVPLALDSVRPGRGKRANGGLFKSPGGGFIAERGGPGGLRVNERIRAREVRLIDDAGNQLGVMTLFDAMKAARDAGLDVVEISPNAVPPVCKLVDYGKFLYEQSKKAHEAKRHQKSSHIKEVKFRPSTAEHDYQVRKNQIIRFLGEGHKVKAMIFHRGREMAHQDVGRAKMTRLLKDITDYALVEFGPRMEANILLALLAPKKGATTAVPARSAPSAAEGQA